MGNFFRRFLANVRNFFSALFNICLKLKFVLPFCILLGFGSFAFTYKSVIQKVGGKEDFEEAQRYIEIKDIIEEKFIDQVDRKTMGNSAAAAMVSGLNDEWSKFMSEADYRTFKLSSNNEYADIGMSLLRDENSGGYQVISMDPDSPAVKSGLAVGMIITAVDGEKLSYYNDDEVRTLIRSKMNGKFQLEIAGGQFYVEVDCTGMVMSSVKSRLEKTGAGYVQIKNFEAGSGESAVNAIEKLLSEGATALVIDLRGNPGGLTAELQSLLDYLLPKGNLFSEVDKAGNKVVYESDGMCIQLPMVVLINTETYKEAEVCAAVLHEYQWATLMGEATSGNTRNQETIELSDGTAIRLSTKAYITPNGTDIASKGGVVPDLIIYNSDPSATGTTEGTTGGMDGTASTSSDDQLMQALKFLS